MRGMQRAGLGEGLRGLGPALAPPPPHPRLSAPPGGTSRSSSTGGTSRGQPSQWLSQPSPSQGLGRLPCTGPLVTLSISSPPPP